MLGTKLRSDGTTPFKILENLTNYWNSVRCIHLDTLADRKVISEADSCMKENTREGGKMSN